MKSLVSNYRKRVLFAVVWIVCLIAAASFSTAQAQDFEIPKPTGIVSDFAGVIDDETEQSLEKTLINLKDKQKIEFAIVTVKTTGDRDIFDYALAIGRQWGIGFADEQKQGLLILVAVDDRKYHTLVSRHLQGELTDGTVGSIQRQYLVPAFRAGQYGEGLTNTVRAYIDTLASKRGFSTAGIYQQDNNTSRPPRSSSKPNSSSYSTFRIIVIIIVILIFLFAGRRRGGGGCLNAMLLGSVLNNLTRGGSSWSGGGFGGSSGDSGGGFGGFGGGGDFDGGGAGGSW
jgi:uncharacterized protein